MLGAAVYRNALDCRIRRYKTVADLAFWNSIEGERLPYSTGYRCDLLPRRLSYTMVSVQRHHPIFRMLHDSDTASCLQQWDRFSLFVVRSGPANAECEVSLCSMSGLHMVMLTYLH
jgi:hypothetical protein